MSTIVTLTMNPALDVSCGVDNVTPERKLRCSQPKYEPGGGGINVARAIQKLGGEATALWTRGGAIGQFFEELLNERNIDHQPLAVQGMTRESLSVFEGSSGLQYRFSTPGPKLDDAEVGQCMASVDNLQPKPEFLVLSGSVPPGVADDFYAQIADRTNPECRVIVDTNGNTLQSTLKSPVFLIKPNLNELGQFVGRKVETDSEIELAARRLIDQQQVQVVVVSIGAAGAILVTADTFQQMRSPTVPILSKVGAGDSMVAGIVLSLSRGLSIESSVRFGVASGAAAVMTPGTKLCKREDTERLFQQMEDSVA